MWLLSMSVREYKLHSPTVVGTVYKLHQQTGGIDFTMELFHMVSLINVERNIYTKKLRGMQKKKSTFTYRFYANN